jgi:hypothetical protein
MNRSQSAQLDSLHRTFTTLAQGLTTALVDAMDVDSDDSTSSSDSEDDFETMSLYTSVQAALAYLTQNYLDLRDEITTSGKTWNPRVPVLRVPQLELLQWSRENNERYGFIVTTYYSIP